MGQDWKIGLLLVGIAAGVNSKAVATEDAAVADAGDRAAQCQVQVAWTDEPLLIDGQLDEPVWQQATGYPLMLAEDRVRDNRGRDPQEPGTVRFAWNRTHFYAAIEFVDHDVVQESDQDQDYHHRTGDVAELFLKPDLDGATHYWEFYVTPNSRRTAFSYPGKGRLGLPSSLAYESGLEVAAVVNGAINEWRDNDRGWAAEMAIPLAELASAGVPLDPDHPWTLLVGRYNFGRHLPTLGPELSSFPPLPVTRFHLHDAYTPVRLIAPARP